MGGRGELGIQDRSDWLVQERVMKISKELLSRRCGIPMGSSRQSSSTNNLYHGFSPTQLHIISSPHTPKLYNYYWLSYIAMYIHADASNMCMRHNTNAYPLRRGESFLRNEDLQKYPGPGTYPNRDYYCALKKNQWDNFSGKPNIH